jgi:hypothetical protein
VTSRPAILTLRVDMMDAMIHKKMACGKFHGIGQ